MGIAELLLIAVGLSMDALAVSVCKGLGMKTGINLKQTFLIALFFGGFQALMPFIGWLVGSRFEKHMTAYDHWIAFALLCFIGGKMLYECIFKKGEDTVESESDLDVKELFVLAVATSIDALAVGVTFALLPDVNIGTSVLLIGLTTFLLSGIGVFIGNRFGSRFEKKAEIAGGIILILIGLKILLEHLGVINF